jgi:hypothetical protein
MTKLQKSIVIDGERVTVEMTDAEQAEFEALRANDEAIKAKRIAEKNALLAKLGITEQEAALILG